ncbi:MAG TPA: type II and III secretion system protein family protein, partial [Salinarimonas sp.]|nr:type II and III secretion system protein family protein [Salinarimonas sp.]
MSRISAKGFGRTGRRRSRLALAIAIAAPIVGTGLLAIGLSTAAAARALTVELREDRTAGVRVVQGKSQNLRTSRAFVDLVVGDPDIADVMPLTDRTLYVLGRKSGTTNVSIFDAEKRLVGVIDVEVGADVPRIADAIERDVPGADTRVGTANGRAVLSGTVPDAPSAARAAAASRAFSEGVVNNLRVRQPQQVMLEVRFVEASRDAGRELGLSFNVNGKNANAATGSSLTGILAGVTGNTPFGALVGRIIAGGITADVLIQALEDRGLARRLAEPNLVALSGEKASFLAGGEFPVPVAGDRDKITVDYKKFGVGLTFLPTVLEDGIINLRIEPEVSQIDPTTAVKTASVAVPGIIVRRASTVIELRDGQSFAIAGLLQSVNQETKQQLPWISDVPIIGALFRSTSFERRETDL